MTNPPTLAAQFRVLLISILKISLLRAVVDSLVDTHTNIYLISNSFQDPGHPTVTPSQCWIAYTIGVLFIFNFLDIMCNVLHIILNQRLHHFSFFFLHIFLFTTCITMTFFSHPISGITSLCFILGSVGPKIPFFIMLRTI